LGQASIAFPRIERVTVHGYDLYPGTGDSRELDLKLGVGPWLVLGVNGLGKSTLLLLMRYMLTGAVRTRGPGFAGERDDLQAVNNRFFAVRVLDGAQNATASIEIHIGDAQLLVERSLSNLALIKAVVSQGQSTQEITDEAAYREAFTALVGVSQFEDVVRALDHLIFYLEVRQSLIWDGAAQFELFRALLTPNLSADLRRLEGEIVSADSAARNLSATLFKITSRRQKEAVRKVNADDTRARIAAAQGELDALLKDEITLTDELDQAETERGDYNLQVKRAEKELDDAAQAYEKLKFEVLRQAFASVSPTDQYVFLKLISEKICLACNQNAPDAAKEIQARSDAGHCVVCGNPRKFDANVEDIGEAIKSKAVDAYESMAARRGELEDLRRQFIGSNELVYALQKKLSAIRLDAEAKHATIRGLKKNLPAEESLELSREEDRIVTLREQVQVFRNERALAEQKIDELLTQLKQATEQVRERLETAFNQRAAPFFAEQVRLVYAPRTTKIGQGGRSFEFPAFEVEMTSGVTLSQFVRRTQEQVSLSQREYLDIIFRMILIDELGSGTGTLVVDGPEGSLDAVFAGRAGELFAHFAEGAAVNVVLACNIIEGGFIPRTLLNYPGERRRSRVVNLIEQASPTQALVSLRSLYVAKVDEILAQDSE
jgi:hypothetical protein